MNNAILQVDQVVKRFSVTGGTGDVTALNGVTVSINAGECVAIMGASGSGKSTLMHLMAGLTHATSGTVRLAGASLGDMPDGELTLFRRRKIGLVFQSFNLVPTLTSLENVVLPALLDGRGNELLERAGTLLKNLGLSHRRNYRPDTMSGGEQQRVAIARALINDPAIVLADEPTGNLDSASSKAVCELLVDLTRQHNKPVVMVTHEPSVAVYADRVIVIRDGKLVDEFATAGLDGAAGLSERYQRGMADVVGA